MTAGKFLVWKPANMENITEHYVLFLGATFPCTSLGGLQALSIVTEITLYRKYLGPFIALIMHAELRSLISFVGPRLLAIFLGSLKYGP